jgi:hypothetical protein
MMYLRDLTVGFAAGDASPYVPPYKKMAMSTCIFGTQLKEAATVAEANILLGSTGALFNDKVEDFFNSARRQRFRLAGADYDMELMRKWVVNPIFVSVASVVDVYDTLKSMQVIETICKQAHNLAFKRNAKLKKALEENPRVTKALPANADTVYNQNAMTTLMIAQLHLTFDDPVRAVVWRSFDRTNQIARSHFVMPGTNGSVNFFTPIPRCVKCRINHNYNISTETEDALKEYKKLNIPLACAEDLVHCKLRVMYPDDLAGAGLIDRVATGGGRGGSGDDDGPRSSSAVGPGSGNDTEKKE